jgi:penicillin amidase
MNLPRLLLRLLLGRRLPITTGTLAVPGIRQPVTIRRDRFGVPYIEAQTDADAWYGLGFCQGQDRAFQVEMLLRITRGTLAELVGGAGLPIDRLSRRIGFHWAAHRHLEVLDPDSREGIAAYARGLTDGAHLGCPKPAHEFALLRTRPTPVEAVDVLANMVYVGFSLSAWTAKLARLLILRQDGPDALRALDHGDLDWMPATQPVGVPSGPALDRLGQDLARMAELLGAGAASNNWAVAASRSATGRPILANDPHLPAMLPAPWYLVHLRTPDWVIRGGAFVGSPTISAGHNDVAAWGVTAGFGDNIDLFLEQVGEDGCSVLEGDRYVPCTVLRETIQVKGQAPVIEDVLITPRGPIISPVLDGEVGAISMRATWMAPMASAGPLHIPRVRSFADFRAAMGASPITSVNMVYADTSDTVGWQLVGAVPRRGAGWGVLPLPGWDPAFHWQDGPLPFEEMPHLSNPETGFVATANNKPTAGRGGPYLGSDWADGYRLARIVEVLQGRTDWDLAGMQRLQLDEVCLPWREMREAVLAAPAATDEARVALELLREWDGVVAAGSAGAAVYEAFLAEMRARLARAKAPNAFAWAVGRGFHPLLPRSHFGMRQMGLLVQLVREQPDGWFERPWPDEVASVLGSAVRWLQTRVSPSPARWAWGRVRPLRLVHSLAARRPLDKVFNRGPIPRGGDGETVAQTGRQYTDLRVNPTVIANLRMVVDVGNWEESRFVLAGGQSGNPLSPHYADQFALWQRGEALALPWSEEAVQAAAHRVLRLVPE